MYHAGWAWAGSTPFKGTKLMASYFGGTRNPMVISWPGHIAHDGKMREQFHHVVDIVPTIYDILDITPPKVVNGYEQMPIDGVSLAYTFDEPEAPTREIRAVLRQQRQPRHLQRRLVRGDQGAVHPLGYARLGQAPRHLGLGDGPVGALRSPHRLLPGERPRRGEPGEARGDEGALPRGRRRAEGFSDRRRQLAAPPPGGPGRHALQRVDLRPRDAPHAGIHGARRRPAEHEGDDRRRVRRRTPTACSMRSAARAAGSASTWTTATSSTSTT